MAKSLYDVLGIPPTAQQAEIKKAYYQKIKEIKDPEQLKEINGAYNTLSNPERRREYDLSLRGPEPTREGSRGNRGWGGFSDFFDGGDVDLEEIFSRFTGRNSPRQSARRIPAIEVIIQTDLESLFTKKVHTIQFIRQQPCSCYSKKQKCPYCQGKGSRVRIFQIGSQKLEQTEPCTHCGGVGFISGINCRLCGNTFVVSNNVTMNITLSRDLNQIQEQGKNQGHQLPDSLQKGSVIFKIQLQETAGIKLVNNEVEVIHRVLFVNFIFGGFIQFSTLGFNLTHELRPNSIAPLRVRYPQKGLIQGREIGDLIVILVPLLPSRESLNNSQINLLKEFF